MADKADAGDAEQRRTAVFGVVEAPAKPTERTPRQERADHSGKRSRQFLSEEPLDRVDEPFTRFQRDVARETVADYHVRVALVHFARLHVADEIERRDSSGAGAPLE